MLSPPRSMLTTWLTHWLNSALNLRDWSSVGTMILSGIIFINSQQSRFLFPTFHRFSDKNQKAIDLLRTKCLSLKSMVLCDGKLYEIMRGNFERADRRSVIRTTVNSKVTIHYLLANYEELLFGWSPVLCKSCVLPLHLWSFLISALPAFL